jgi:hypothetical protein
MLIKTIEQRKIFTTRQQSSKQLSISTKIHNAITDIIDKKDDMTKNLLRNIMIRPEDRPQILTQRP